MAQQILNPNSLAPNDKLGDTPWDYTVKLNANFDELYAVEAISNRIIINEFEDFPEPMLPNLQYYIGSHVVMPDTLPASWGDLPDNIEFAGSVVASSITWNGTGSLFTGVDMIRFRVLNLLIDTPNGTIYNITEVSVPTVVNLLTASVANCLSMGTINVFGVVLSLMGVANANQGLSVGDKTIVFNVGEVAITSTNPSFVGFDISGSSLSTMEVTNARINAPVGGFFLKGDAASANINAGQIADITSCEIVGGATALSVIVDNDDGYKFESVTGVINSAAIGHCYINTGDEVTTVITAGVEVPVDGVFTQGVETSQSSSSVDGVITMLNRVEMRGTITINMDLDKAGGGNDAYIFRAKKIPISTGITEDVDGVFTTITLGGGDTDAISISGPVRFVTGDQFYASVQSAVTSDDITANTQGFTVL